jgi:hypothetical protein
MADRIQIIDDNIRGPDPAPAAGPAPVPNRPVNPVIQAIDTYMGDQTQENLGNVPRIIRENHEDPRHYLSYAVSVGNADLVEELINSVGNTREQRADAANYYPGDDAWGETTLTTALTNPNDDNILPILEVLLRNGADPNLVADGRSNFFDTIYQDEMDSGALGQQDRLDYLQRVRNLARQYNHRSPPEFQRRDQDPNNIIGGKKKRKRTRKPKKNKSNKKSKSTKKKRKTKKNRKSKKHRKK